MLDAIEEEGDFNPSSAALSSAALLDDTDSNAAVMKPFNIGEGNDEGKLEIL